MKHFELQDKIYWHWRRDNRGADGLQPMIDYRRALLAVVELHKVILHKNYDTDIDRYECQVCKGALYPCETIQAIEKELK